MRLTALPHLTLPVCFFSAIDNIYAFPRPYLANEPSASSVQISSSSKNHSIITSSTALQAQQADLSWGYEPRLGKLKGVPLFMTTVNCLFEIASGDSDGFEVSKVYKFPPYDKDVEISIEGQWGRQPGKWRRRFVMDAVLRIVRDMALKKRFEGLAGQVSLWPSKKLEAKVLFRNPSRGGGPPALRPPVNQPTNSTLSLISSAQDIGITNSTIEAFSDKGISNYSSWDKLILPQLATGTFLNQSEELVGAQAPQFYVKFSGPVIPPADWFIAVATGLRIYAGGLGRAVAAAVDYDIDDFATRLEVKQYYHANPRSDRVMNRRQALGALVLLPPYAIKNKVFQECTMVMEQRPKEPIGIIKISKTLPSLPSLQSGPGYWEDITPS